jgi:hypothetical protein
MTLYPVGTRRWHEPDKEASPGGHRPALGGRDRIPAAVRVLGLVRQGRFHGWAQVRPRGAAQ